MEQSRGEVRWRTMTDKPWRSTRETWGAARPDPQGARLSQRRVAELSGLTHGAICMIEQNKVSPSVASPQKLLSVYELPLSRFFAEEEVASTPSVVIKAEQLIELAARGLHEAGAQRQQSAPARLHAGDLCPGTDTGGVVKHQGKGGHRAGRGSVLLTLAGQTYELCAGDSYVIDTGEPHSFSNPRGRSAASSAPTPRPAFNVNNPLCWKRTGKETGIMTEHVNSYYAASANKHAPYPTLTEQLECDVCVIGAGYTGLSVRCIWWRRGTRWWCWRRPGSALAPAVRNGGQIVNSYSRDIDTIEANCPPDQARLLGSMLFEGPDHPRADQTLQHPVRSAGGRGLCRRDREAASRAQGAEGALGEVGQRPAGAARCHGVREVVASDRYVGALLDKSGGHIHPPQPGAGRRKPSAFRGAYLRAVRRHQHYPGQPALVKTAKGAVKARFIVVAGNAYLGNLVPELASKSMPCGTR